MWKKYSTTILLCIVVALGGFFIGREQGKNNNSPRNNPELRGKLVRAGNYAFINPLLECEIVGEDEGIGEFKQIKDAIENAVKTEKSEGKASSIAVYLRTLNSGRWIGVNEEEKFSPASLLKVATMVAYLKIAESDPAILQQKITYNGEFDYNSLVDVKPAAPLEKGHTYTVSELIRRMIVYSGNNARALLIIYLRDHHPLALKEVYDDLNLALPETDADDFMSAKDYSSLFRVLYNSTYLNKQMSELALKILSDVDFKDGIVSGVPEDLTVAHKFGERSITTPAGIVERREFHDCGIVYYPKHPYFLCVMTKGSDFADLESAIADVSRVAYTEVDTFFKNLDATSTTHK